MRLSRAFAVLTLVGLACLPVLAQEAIYRCGNTYTNDVRQAQQAGCQRIEATPVTVPGTQVQRRSASVEQPAPTPQAPQAPQARAHTRIDSAQQRARDADARFILETELRKAQERLAQLQAEFKQGEPDKQGIEGRHHQRYLDRVQALREELARQQADVASLQRELARLPATVASTP